MSEPYVSKYLLQPLRTVEQALKDMGREQKQQPEEVNGGKQPMSKAITQ